MQQKDIQFKLTLKNQPIRDIEKLKEHFSRYEILGNTSQKL